MARKVVPVRPDDIAKEKKNTFPSAVLESFNEIIAQNFSGGCAEIR